MQLKILKWLLQFFKKLSRKSNSIAEKLKREIFFFQLEERESDIYVVSFPKSGTTWTQVIIYNLLTDGAMDFEHINDVSPWLSNQAYLGMDPEKINKMPAPRFFKSHDAYDKFQSGFKNKIIFVYRDGKDLAASFYHHNKNYQNPELTFSENFEKHFTDKSSTLNWFKYNKKWMENENGFTILYISYEELKNNFDAALQKISHFLNIPLTPEIIERTRKNASFDYMKLHETKFGEPKPKKKEFVFDQFIRAGVVGEGTDYMNEEQKKSFQVDFEKHLAAVWPK